MLRASVFKSTRDTLSCSKAYFNNRNFASRLIPDPCAEAASHGNPEPRDHYTLLIVPGVGTLRSQVAGSSQGQVPQILSMNVADRGGPNSTSQRANLEENRTATNVDHNDGTAA